MGSEGGGACVGRTEHSRLITWLAFLIWPVKSFLASLKSYTGAGTEVRPPVKMGELYLNLAFTWCAGLSPLVIPVLLPSPVQVFCPVLWG